MVDIERESVGKKKKTRCGCCTLGRCIVLLVVVSVLCMALGAGSIPFLNKYFKEKVEEVSA